MHSFFQDNDITMNGISIQTNALAGMHIRAERELNENEIVARIPKNAVLSTKTTAIADILEEYEIVGLLGLTLALMFEKSRGLESPWYEYIITLPERVDIPLLWTAKEISWLDGTELGDSILEDKNALQEDYDSIILPILNDELFSPLEEFSFEKFQNASSVVSSRAFNVDDYHQQSMVPLADIFNHQSRENVHFQCNSNVCGLCGEAGLCDCDILDHVTEIDNPVSKDLETPILEENNSNIQDEEDEGIMEMVVVNSCSSNEEVFNTYGQHSNSYLLNRYGFCEEDNPNDVVNFEMQDVINLLKQLSILNLSKRLSIWETLGRDLCHKFQKRFDILRDIDLSKEEMEEYIGEEDEDDEEQLDDGFYLDHNQNPSFHMYCFLHLMLMNKSTLNMYIINNKKYKLLLEKMADKMWNSAKILETGIFPLPMSLPLMQVINILCRNRISKYPTTLVEDLALYKTIKDTDQQKLKSALILRISDKSILAGFLNKYDSMQAVNND